MQALLASESRLLKAGKKHWQQLKDRAALNRLAAEPNPRQAAEQIAEVLHPHNEFLNTSCRHI